MKSSVKRPYTGKPRGFAVISRSKALAIHRAGGLAVSRDRAHMAAIGAIGGAASVATKRAVKAVRAGQERLAKRFE